MKRTLTLSLIALIALIGCTRRASIDPNSNRAASQPATANAANTAATNAAAAVQEASFALTESYEAMPNPGKGWVGYIFDLNNPESADIGPLVSTLYTNNISWGDLEPQKNQFRWDKIDRLVQMAKRNGMKLRFSLNSVDPTTTSLTYRPQIPAWFIATYPGAGRWISSYYGAAIAPGYVNPYNGNAGWIYEPDYASAAYINEYWRFLCMLVTHWKANPDWVETIEGTEISNYGFWGEWHSDFPWTAPYVKQSVLNGFVDWYFALFPETSGTFTSKRMEISGFFTAYGDSGVTRAVQAGADIARKCMGICFTKGGAYLSSSDYSTMMAYRYWRSFRGEFGSWEGPIDSFFDSKGGNYVTNTKGAIDEALNMFRADRLGWYVHATLQNPSGYGNETLAEYFQKRSGYRFYLSKISYPSSVRAGQKIAVKTEWSQRAMSKLYLPTFVAIDLVRTGGSERFAIGQQPFEAVYWHLGPQDHTLNYEYTLPPNVPPGKYDVRIALVDQNRKPMINLANAGKESPNPRQFTFYAAGALEVRP